MANLGPLTAEIGLGHPSKFQRVSRLGFVTAATSLTRGQPNFARCLAVSWTGTLFSGFLSPVGILPGAKFTLRPSLAFYTGSITARHSSIRRQPNFAESYKEWNYRTFAEGSTHIRQSGHHVGQCNAYVKLEQCCSAINCLSSGVNILAGSSSVFFISERKGPTRIGRTCVAHTSPHSAAAVTSLRH